MFYNLFRLKGANKKFIHTSHGVENEIIMFIGRFNSSLQYPKDYQDSHLEDLVTDENFYCCKTCRI